jgi:hypothetical protein
MGRHQPEFYMKTLAATLTVAALASAAHAQPLLHVTARNRFIDGVNSVTNPDGSTVTNGPIHMEGPPSDDPALPPFFPINLDVPGAINVHAMQEGGFNGIDSIELHAWDLDLNGDGPDGGSAYGTIDSMFSYTFDVTQPLDYHLEGMLHSLPPNGMGYARAHFSLTGPGVSVDLITTDGVDSMVMLDGLSGHLAPGTYIFRVETSAHIVDFAPGPVNAHADGPLAAIRVTPAASACGSADFNCDGDIGTDSDINAFFACLSGTCPAPPCTNSADFNGDGDVGTDADIEAFFRVLAGGTC